MLQQGDTSKKPAVTPDAYIFLKPRFCLAVIPHSGKLSVRVEMSDAEVNAR